MDSFYDQPRKAPKPTNINKITTPIIPEVSLLQQSVESPQIKSYKAWKSRNPIGFQDLKSKENFSPSREKHVRFNHIVNKPKTLEEIYMANVPNRNLDLSVVEPTTPTEMLKIDGRKDCYDIFNYKKDFAVKENGYFPNYYDNYSREVVKKSDNEPTTRDLLKVIQQQNEQILLLQKQVSCLLETNKLSQKRIDDGQFVNPMQKQIESTTEESNQFKPCKSNYRNLSPDLEPIHFDRNKHKKGPVSKIAIDVMTSFEVSFRPQNQNLINKNPQNNLCESLKIQEIHDDVHKNVLEGIKKSDDKLNNCEVSLSLQEPLNVIQQCPSPEQSIHVDMQDYSSDEEDESDLGWTLYNNIMGQVNNIFKNAQCEQNIPLNDEKIKDKTLRRVKEATVKHLKSIGVNLPFDDGKEVLKDNTNECKEVSFAVKQLLMKYLPDEQLAKVQKEEDTVKRRPEFSFATIQYMKKYNLLGPSNDDNQNANARQKDKILDVTALKQQPKLL